MVSVTHDRIREEWNDLWSSSFEDHLVAECVASKNYPLLFVERGTVIRATRDYKHIEIDEILDRHEQLRGQRLSRTPIPEVGGWSKFIRDNMKRFISLRKTKRQLLPPVKPKTGPLRKGGRGWFNKRPH